MSYSIWMMISLLLHLITILALIVLYQRYTLLKTEIGPFGDELQRSLEKFVKEIEEENEAFYQLLVEHLKERKEQGKGEEKGEADQPALETEEPPSPSVDSGEKGSDPLFEQVVQLYQEGYSPQEIGRLLNKGVGEIQLLLNLYHHQD